MARHLTYLLFSALLLTSATASAQKLYKIVDENGRVTYTDKKPSSDKTYQELTVEPSKPDPQAVKKARANKQRRQQKQNSPITPLRFRGYKAIDIVSPSNDQNILQDQQTVTVKLALTPELQAGHQVQLLFDGRSIEKPSRSLNFVLTELERGSHNIKVQVLDTAGTVIANSDPVTIHVRRHTANNSPVAAPAL